MFIYKKYGMYTPTRCPTPHLPLLQYFVGWTFPVQNVFDLSGVFLEPINLRKGTPSVTHLPETSHNVVPRNHPWKKQTIRERQPQEDIREWILQYS